MQVKSDTARISFNLWRDTSNVINKNYLQSIAKQDVQKYCAKNFQCSHLLCRTGRKEQGLLNMVLDIQILPHILGPYIRDVLHLIFIYLQILFEAFMHYLQTFFCDYSPDFSFLFQKLRDSITHLFVCMHTVL